MAQARQSRQLLVTGPLAVETGWDSPPQAREGGSRRRVCLLGCGALESTWGPTPWQEKGMEEERRRGSSRQDAQSAVHTALDSGHSSPKGHQTLKVR